MKTDQKTESSKTARKAGPKRQKTKETALPQVKKAHKHHHLEDYEIRNILLEKGKPIEEPLELRAWEAYDRVLGMDEAGRGPLCGPLVVAGVIFPRGYQNHLLNDSKKLTQKMREALYPIITADALAYQIRIVPPNIIDEENIYRAVQHAMEDIADALEPQWILTDAMPLPKHPMHESIIKGDSKSLSIAAASVLAKVTRDHYMEDLDLLYPMYGLAKHKGYGTKAHLEAMKTYGVQSFYRMTYKPVARLLEGQPEENLAKPEQLPLFETETEL